MVYFTKVTNTLRKIKFNMTICTQGTNQFEAGDVV